MEFDLEGASEQSGKEVFIVGMGHRRKLCVVPCHYCHIYGT